jgi:hypothetical protein
LWRCVQTHAEEDTSVLLRSPQLIHSCCASKNPGRIDDARDEQSWFGPLPSGTAYLEDVGLQGEMNKIGAVTRAVIYRQHKHFSRLHARVQSKPP